jgi:precorrin-3B synthase
MAAKDGLLVRLRITGGILTATSACALADLAAAYGNGLFDLSSRGNLQIRGVSEAKLPALQDGLRTLGLIDQDAAGESVRNVIASPLAGLHGGLDIRALIATFEARLTEDVALHALPGKFGFVIDDGGWPSLAGIEADVRFDWRAEDGRFSIGLAGTRQGAIRIATCAPVELVERAALIARCAVDLLASISNGRRMRDVVSTIGAERTARACGRHGGAAIPSQPATRADEIVGWRRAPLQSFKPNSATATLGLAAPFGRLDSLMLHRAAAVAGTTPYGELRLTPWRAILIPGAADRAWDVEGFITDPEDPRLRIATCVGMEGCARGSTSTHTDARALAERVALVKGSDIVLHISGCAKGCAKSSPTRFTLVAHDGVYNVVRNGRADAEPTWKRVELADTLSTITETA